MVSADRQVEDLIAQLAGDATPVRPLAPVPVRLAQWFALAMVASGLVALAIGVRPDVGPALAAYPLAAASLISVLIAMSAAWIALTLSVPGAVAPVWLDRLPLLLIGVWAGWWWSAARASGQSLLTEPWHLACVTRALALAVLPLSALFLSARRGLVLNAGRATAMAAVAGAALAAGAVQWTCPIDRAAHLFVSHLVPMLGLAVIVGLGARGAVTR